VPAPTFEILQAHVVRMHHEGTAQDVIEHAGWVADIGWVEGGMGVGYMVWLHRPGVRSGTDAAAHLSPRQLDVARLAAKGDRSAEIAEALGISVYTVRDHLKVIYARLGIASRLELAEIIASLERAQR
jgi:DNA-binding CsgD family transcriptional regulator